MTKKEEILNNTTGLEDDYGYELYSRGLVEDMMEEYGKYCAEQAWAFAGVKTFNEWWSEFQGKEEAE